MKIFFPKKPSSEEVIQKITSEMGSRKIADLLSFDASDTSLEILIKSMGTSKLTFDRKEGSDETCFALCKEKIALTHRAFKGELTKKLVTIIEKAGGRVED